MTNRIYRLNRSFSLSGLIIATCVSFLLINNVFANSADWGLVKRFQTQLEQAQGGKIKAMYEVGRMYERGRGTTRNMASAASWYIKASNAGNTSAKARLGKMYMQGKGVKKDLARAYRLLSEAARSNVPSAQYQLAIMYEIGIGRNENIEKALYWYKKAASGGYYQAERKVKQLKDATSTPFIASTKSQAKPRTSKATKKSKPKSNNVIAAISKGAWQRRKKPAGYLPSSINNCKKVDTTTLKCISNEQERSTGSEIISYSTEASIKATGANKFVVEYTNNVLEVELIQNEVISGVEDEESTASARTSISTGKQEKLHKLECKLNNPKSVTCIKGGFRTLEFSS